MEKVVVVIKSVVVNIGGDSVVFSEVNAVVVKGGGSVEIIGLVLDSVVVSSTVSVVVNNGMVVVSLNVDLIVEAAK